MWCWKWSSGELQCSIILAANALEKTVRINLHRTLGFSQQLTTTRKKPSEESQCPVLRECYKILICSLAILHPQVNRGHKDTVCLGQVASATGNNTNLTLNMLWLCVFTCLSTSSGLLSMEEKNLGTTFSRFSFPMGFQVRVFQWEILKEKWSEAVTVSSHRRQVYEQPQGLQLLRILKEPALLLQLKQLRALPQILRKAAVPQRTFKNHKCWGYFFDLLASVFLIFPFQTLLTLRKAPIYLLSSLLLFSHSLVSDSFVTPWVVVHKDPLSMGFSRQECWSGLPFPPPGHLPNPVIKPASPASSVLQADSLLLSHRESPFSPLIHIIIRVTLISRPNPDWYRWERIQME